VALAGGLAVERARAFRLRAMPAFSICAVLGAPALILGARLEFAGLCASRHVRGAGAWWWGGKLRRDARTNINHGRRPLYCSAPPVPRRIRVFASTSRRLRDQPCHSTGSICAGPRLVRACGVGSPITSGRLQTRRAGRPDGGGLARGAGFRRVLSRGRQTLGVAHMQESQ